MVKNDDTITQEDKRVIFEKDFRNSLKDLRKIRRAARKKKVEDERRKLSDGKSKVG